MRGVMLASKGPLMVCVCIDWAFVALKLRTGHWDGRLFVAMGTKQRGITLRSFLWTTNS